MSDPDQQPEYSQDETRTPQVTKRSGWDNVKDAYILNRETGEISREVYELFMMFLLGSAAGSLYGGLPASRHARNRYIQTSDAALYSSKLEAVGTSYNAGTRGFIRYGYRWGWRTGFLALGFHGISSFLAVYRDKTDMYNYAVASVSTGALYRINLGLRGMIGGGIVGALLGIPAGGMLLAAQHLSGVTLLEFNKGLRKEALQGKQQKLQDREKAFSELIGSINKSIQDKEDDTKR